MNLRKKLIPNFEKIGGVVMEVKLINKEECKEFFKLWGEFACACYNTDKKYAERVGKSCFESGHYSGSRAFSFIFEVKGISRACYDEKTEILTNEGWKLFKDIKEKEVVATLNKDTEKVEFNEINEIIKYYYDGVMDKYKSDNLDLLVTPNHKMFVKKYDVRKEAEWELIPSNELKLGRYRMTKSFNYDNEVDKYIIIKGYEYDRKVKNGKYVTKYSDDLTFDRKIFYQFLAWYISDGSIYYSSKENKYVINISQTQCEENIKNKTVERIMYLIKKMGFNCNYDGRTIRFNSLTLGSYLSKLGNAKDKYIPLDLFKDFNKELAKIFIDEYLKGDGHIDKNGCAKIFTTSKKLSEQLQTLIFITGDTAKVNIDDRRGECHICKNNVIRNNICYVINISKIKNKNPILKTKKHKSEVTYRGNVYCVNVKNHTIFVRRNGVAMWCGNCSHQLVRHSVGVTINQKSQRYCDESYFDYVVPPKIRNRPVVRKKYDEFMKTINTMYRTLNGMLYEIEGIQEDTRYILPNACTTELTIGFTLEALIHFCEERLCSASQWEIRELASLMKEEVIEVLPELKEKLNSKCINLGYCPESEKRCCRRKPNKNKIKIIELEEN